MGHQTGLDLANAYVRNNAKLGCEACTHIWFSRNLCGEAGLVEHHVHVAKILRKKDSSSMLNYIRSNPECKKCKHCSILLLSTIRRVHDFGHTQYDRDRTDMFNLRNDKALLLEKVSDDWTSYDDYVIGYNTLFCPLCKNRADRDEFERRTAEALEELEHEEFDRQQKIAAGALD